MTATRTAARIAYLAALAAHFRNVVTLQRTREVIRAPMRSS